MKHRGRDNGRILVVFEVTIQIRSQTELGLEFVLGSLGSFYAAVEIRQALIEFHRRDLHYWPAVSVCALGQPTFECSDARDDVPNGGDRQLVGVPYPGSYEVPAFHFLSSAE